MNDETIVNQDNLPQKQQKVETHSASPTAHNETPKETPKDKNARKTRLTATDAIAATGVALGLFSPIQLFPSESDLDDNFDLDDESIGASEISSVSGASEMEPHTIVGQDLEVATGVDDSMTFGEAFRTARMETGAGGVFVWHGHTYGTYYSSEWDNLSDDEKEQYWANVNHTSQSIAQEEQEQEIVDEPDLQDADLLDGGELAADNEDEVADIEPEPLDESDEALAEIEPLEEVGELDEVELEPLDEIDDSLAEMEPLEAIPELEPITINELDSDEILADLSPMESEVEVELDPLDEIDDSLAEMEPLEDLPELEPIAINELETEDVLADSTFQFDDVMNTTEAHLDVDPDGLLAIDPNIPMHNDMDMDEFV